jgi:zinc D-Ala-D-Ala carboxypeptidase
MRLKTFIDKYRFPLIVAVVAFIVIVFGGYCLAILSSKLSLHHNPSPSRIISNQQKSNSSITVESKASADSKQEKENFNSSQPTSVDSPNYYGHFTYAQANTNEVITVASYATGEFQRFESVSPEAGKALMKMIYAAREEKVWIIIVSGFRTIEQQQKLFQEQIQRLGSAKKAAKISAPPKYSEHHTGYAVDLADGNSYKQDITLKFENTDAFRWLTRHAQEFGFELSFYKNNPQGVSYEPWHWRYVGSPKATAIFAQARKQK